MPQEFTEERVILYKGRHYTRKPTGYYYNSSTRKHLHQAVWIDANGPIPEGCEIHHRDLNVENNDISNLVCLTKAKHKALHSSLLTDEQRQWKRENLHRTARPKASEWHKSEEGREWHRKNALQMIESGKSGLTRKTELICTQCGKRYTGKPSNKNHFCSNACKSAYRRASGVDDIDVCCAVCGKQFRMNKYDFKRYSVDGKITCSKRCKRELFVKAHQNIG